MTKRMTTKEAQQVRDTLDQAIRNAKAAGDHFTAQRIQSDLNHINRTISNLKVV